MAKKETLFSVTKEVRDIIKPLAKLIVTASSIIPANAKIGKMLDLKEGELLAMLQSRDRVVKLSDGWVKDRILGVDWGLTAAKRLKWADGGKHCADLKGRLPDRFELSMLEILLRNEEIRKEFFPDTVSDVYWSGTTIASNTVSAWYVSFFSGSVSFTSKLSTYYVRPVRSSQ